jgi:hypothetical protein
MSSINSLRDRLRSFLQGDRKKRQLPRRSVKPRIGAYAIHVKDGVRLMVQAGMSDEVWQWLMDHGWRVETHRPDRRQYLDIPPSFVTRLIDSDPAQRRALMIEAKRNAQPKSSLVSKKVT